MRKSFLVLAVVVCIPSVTMACVIDEVPEGWRDAPISVGPDCSFDEAGQGYMALFTGTEAKKIGNGLVYQVFERADQCPGSSESLFVVDCNSLEMIEIRGKSYPAADGFGHSVSGILSPKGAIRLNDKTTIARLAATSTRKEYAYGFDVLDRLNEVNAQNRPDPYCGCRLFYPDSAGATQ